MAEWGLGYLDKVQGYLFEGIVLCGLFGDDMIADARSSSSQFLND
jgi:hypothetical protein